MKRGHAVTRILVSLFFLCSVSIYYASSVLADQTTLTTEQKQRLVETLSAVQQHSIIRYDFEQKKNITLLKRPLISTGKVLFDESQGLYLQYSTPVWTAYLLADNNMFEKKQKASEYKRLAIPQNTGLSQILQSIITADIEALQAYFSLQFAQSDSTWSLILAPLKNSAVNTLDQIVIRGDEYLQSLQINELNGDTMTLMFSHNERSQQQLTPLEQRFFVR